MPTDEAARGRSADQNSNNAHQEANDAKQGRNDAQASSSRREQAQTNKDQGSTNDAQGLTNDAQGLTNDAQGETNAAQDETNVAQGLTNDGIRETIRLLAKSVDANTVSMETVASSFQEMLALYTRIDDRLTLAEDRTKETAQRATAIEVQSNARAGKFMRLWVTLLIVVILVGGGGFGLNAYRALQLCVERNDANASNSILVQRSLDLLPAGSEERQAYVDFLARSVQINCDRLF